MPFHTGSAEFNAWLFSYTCDLPLELSFVAHGEENYLFLTIRTTLTDYFEDGERKKGT